MDRIFATFGVPETVRTDNGPPFNGEEFRSFAQYLGFKHRRVTPRWPRANGEVERFMKTLKKVYRTAHIDAKPWRQEVYRFLRNFRATPHSSTGVPPATLMFGRPMKTRLPQMTQKLGDNEVRRHDKRQKSKMKIYADSRENTKKQPVNVGDRVLVRRDGHIAKHMSPYKTEPFTVSSRKGSMVTATKEDEEITRNSSYFKVIKEEDDDTHLTVTQEEDDTEMSNNATSPEVQSDNLIKTDSPKPQVETKRYPTRIRKPPAYLQDYVAK